MSKPDPFRYFKTSREIIRLAVMMYVRFPLSLRNVEDLLHERGIDVSHEAVRYWWHRFGPMFASEIRKRRIEGVKSSRWRWHLDEMFVKIKGEMRYLWRAVDHEGEVLESFVTKTRDKKAALKFLRKAMKKHGRAGVFVTDKLRSYGAVPHEVPTIAVEPPRTPQQMERAVKGLVMRRVVEAAGDRYVDTTDGVRVVEADGRWVMVLPDRAEAVTHLWAEGPDDESAEALLDEWAAVVDSAGR